MTVLVGTDTRQVLRAAIWMSGAVLAFSAMAVAGRQVSFDLDTGEIMMYRSLIGTAVVVAVAYLTGTWRQITRRKLTVQVVRNSAHFVGQYLWFLSITLIPLAQVFALEFTAPLWALLLAPLVLGERLTRNRVLAACVGFVGILIVTRPNPETINPGLIYAAVAAICFAWTALFTRRLTRTETLTCILFWMTLLQSIMGVVVSGVDGHIALPSLEIMPWLVLVALGGLIAHFCLTKALSIAPAAVVMPVDFARLPLIAVIGALVYSEAVDVWVFVGAAVIFAANYANIVIETRAGRAQRPVV